MKVTFVHHSCYIVEDDFTQIIFDYTQGSLPPKKDKGRVFVVTHSHADHFSRRIFRLDGDLYILSEEVEAPLDLPTLHLSPFEEIVLQDLAIKTSGSTDQGLSILLTLGGKHFLHAGDLNIWHWPEDSKEEREQMEADFDRYLSVFEGVDLHALFFNVDYRLGEEYIHGPKAAIERLKPKHFFPMHFTEHPHILPVFRDLYKDSSTKIHLLEENQSISI
ncbi:MAG: hypothetical protein GX853_09905 [Chloroflexi bacterium]|jgi:L-ascorbate metabolism protein UlaG (beta-lactamase superfamily)|nr:hypothetical protein [Chloroflexota bacterium]